MSQTPKTINVVGCGNVGKTLSRLWTKHSVLTVQSILNRSRPSSLAAARFVGAGRAVDSYAEIPPADLVMIAASDESIESCCQQLCGAGTLGQGTIVFHCSGSLSSDLLEPARQQGASIASIHPVKSFADPSAAVESFAGTFCAIEGDAPACEVLADCLQRCGAKTFFIAPELKTVYHTATVMVCNYLVALMEAGLRCLEKAGLSRDTAMEIIEPLVRETVRNTFELGPIRALTGPIARGEPSVVAAQCEALGQWDERLQRVYKSLGQVAVELSGVQGHAEADTLAAIEKMLHG